MLKRRFLVAALCRNDRHAVCHSIFARSLARSSFNGPHGISLTYAECDQPLMNSPMTKLKFCHSEHSEESLRGNRENGDPSALRFVGMTNTQ